MFFFNIKLKKKQFVSLKTAPNASTLNFFFSDFISFYVFWVIVKTAVVPWEIKIANTPCEIMLPVTKAFICFLSFQNSYLQYFLETKYLNFAQEGPDTVITKAQGRLGIFVSTQAVKVLKLLQTEKNKIIHLSLKKVISWPYLHLLGE